jgi:hypothetical protein
VVQQPLGELHRRGAALRQLRQQGVGLAAKASSGTTRFTSPIRSASAAATGCARTSRSKARFSDTLRRRIAITMAGTKPIFTSG